MVVVRCLILCSKFVKNRLSAWFTALSRPLDKSWGEGRGKGKRKGRREGNGRGRGDEERGRGEGEEGKEAGGREGGRRGIPRMKNPSYGPAVNPYMRRLAWQSYLRNLSDVRPIAFCLEARFCYRTCLSTIY